MVRQWSHQEILKAIELAERQVRYEIMLCDGEDKGASPPIQQMCAKGLASAKRKVERSILATELLPQAQIIVRQKEAREKAVRKSVVGGLRDTLEHLVMFVDGLPITPNPPYPFEGLVKNKEAQAELKKTWAKLCREVRQKRVSPSLESIIGLLNLAAAIMCHEDFPPLPDHYKIYTKTYSSREVN